MDAKVCIQGPLTGVPAITLGQEGRKEDGPVGEEGNVSEKEE